MQLAMILMVPILVLVMEDTLVMDLIVQVSQVTIINLRLEAI